MIRCLLFGHRPEDYEPPHHPRYVARIISQRCTRCGRDLILLPHELHALLNAPTDPIDPWRLVRERKELWKKS